jgi:transposase InsO family protein
MSTQGKDNFYDNAIVETLFKTLKSELVWRTIFFTRADAQRDTAR